MAELNTTETTDRLGQQERSQEAASSDDAYSQYQQALRMAFDHTRAGRLVDASQSLLEISEWLVCNSRELGVYFLYSSFPSSVRQFPLNEKIELTRF